jgi:hypothetical protein
LLSDILCAKKGFCDYLLTDVMQERKQCTDEQDMVKSK